MSENEVGKRERIMEEACRLFARKGFSATSIREITQAAKVTNPMIYYYFGSKEELFRAVIQEAHLALVESMAEMEVEGRGFEEVLVDTVQLYFRLIRESPDTARLFLYLQYGPERLRFEETLRNIQDSSKAMWRGLLEAAVVRGSLAVIDLEVAILQIFGLIHMPMLMFLSGDNIALDDVTARTLVTQLMDGLRARGEGGD